MDNSRLWKVLFNEILVRLFDEKTYFLKKTMESVIKHKKLEEKRTRKMAIRELLMEPTMEDRQREVKLWIRRKRSHGVK